ncbi:tRNA (adenosine(37)-N6)-threonylcarbamoyltransferase complex dimerization subunit type 1 TsaB [Candidatus Saganbacteria bacterium]|nr:tRNA (adenosine(37)-N6)-threonylcarbamoyltransferase complex dimerization subunit type 1 TsaB [Candidatus Saganbacteria bacterium]
MAILGISSATKIVSVGFCSEGDILAEMNVAGKQSFTEDLMAYIDETVKQADVKLSGIAAASGPGSYNGLRGGLSTAKTLAQTLSLPLIEVSTLEAIAYNLIDIEATICAVSDARRDEYNLAFFASSNNSVRRLTKDSLIHLDKIVELLSKVAGIIRLSGVTDDIYTAIKALNPDTQIKQMSQELSIAKGINVALIGEQLLKDGKTSDVLTLTPKYSVEPNIREFKGKG